jgi:uncharacterized protein (TIRG00374 family)
MTLFRVGAGVVLLAGAVLFFRSVSSHDVVRSLRAASVPFLLLAALANLLTLSVKSSRWGRILSTLGPIDHLHVLRFLLIGFAVNAVIPASAGDVSRIYMVSSHTGHRRSAILSTIIIERAVEGVALALLMLIALPILRVVPWLRRGAVAFEGGILALLLLLTYTARRCHTPPAAARSKRERFIAVLAESIRRVEALSVLVPVLLLSVAEWILQSVSYWCGLRAFHQPLGLPEAFVALCAVNLALLARVTPGGVGAYQLAFAASMTLFGVPRAVGLACSTALHVVTLTPPVAIGLALLVRAPRSVRRAIWGTARRARAVGADMPGAVAVAASTAHEDKSTQQD